MLYSFSWYIVNITSIKYWSLKYTHSWYFFSFIQIMQRNDVP